MAHSHSHACPPRALSRALLVALSAGVLALTGCEKAPEVLQAIAPKAPATPVTPPEAPAQIAAAAPAYMPPTAEQLYQMVAPIAVYPDKLVAQVLAGATYPAQLTQADQWLVQNGGLQGGPLADAADRQPWDPSVKSLTAFRSVLDQMAKNLPWTTALGEAYYNDPADVMNAIQVMRQRAASAGELKSTPKLRVATGNRPLDLAQVPNAQVAYTTPVVIEPPPQFITIEPAAPDVVYVPSYDPERIYGTPLPVYPGYAYAPPQAVYAEPRYSNAQIATAGALTFGLGVVVGSALERHDWGWHSWGMNWGDRRPPPGQAPHGEDRPTVVYNRSNYVSRSETVVNNNIRNVYNNGPSPQQEAQQNQALQIQARQQQAQLDAQRVQQAQQQAQYQQNQRAQQMQQDTSRRQQEQQLQVQAQQQQAQIHQQEQQQRAQLTQQSRNQELARQQQDQVRHQQEQQAHAQALQQTQMQQQQAQVQQDQARRQQDAQQQAQRVQAQAQQQQAQQMQRSQQEQARRQQEQQSQQNAQSDQRRQQEQQHQQQRAQQEQVQHQQAQVQALAQQQAHQQAQQQARQQQEQQQRQQQEQQQRQAQAQQQQAQQMQAQQRQQRDQQAAHRPGRQGEEQRP